LICLSSGRILVDPDDAVKMDYGELVAVQTVRKAAKSDQR